MRLHHRGEDSNPGDSDALGSPRRRQLRLGLLGWAYVGTVGVLATWASTTGAGTAYAALLLLTLPTCVVALMLTYPLVGVAALLGVDPGAATWPGSAPWVLVWVGTAWLNVRLLASVATRRRLAAAVQEQGSRWAGSAAFPRPPVLEVPEELRRMVDEEHERPSPG